MANSYKLAFLAVPALILTFHVPILATSWDSVSVKTASAESDTLQASADSGTGPEISFNDSILGNIGFSHRSLALKTKLHVMQTHPGSMSASSSGTILGKTLTLINFQSGDMDAAIGFGTNRYFTFSDEMNGFSFRVRANRAVGLFSSGLEALVINPSGNIGMGTRTPSHRLEVIGDIKSRHILANSAQIGTAVNLNDGGINFNQGALSFGASGTLITRSFVDTDSLIASKIKIGSGGWTIEEPDYVFDEDYPLPKLGEVEKFIKQNRHLPEIPNATAFRKDGMNIADMNFLLLKKVEELTLYVIEQDKKIKRLEAKIR